MDNRLGSDGCDGDRSAANMDNRLGSDGSQSVMIFHCIVGEWSPGPDRPALRAVAAGHGPPDRRPALAIERHLHREIIEAHRAVEAMAEATEAQDAVSVG